MATLLARLTIREGGERAFESIAAKLYAASHRLEPDLLRYEYYRSATPRQYYCLLAFTDEAAFLTHQISEHHESASADLRDLIEDSSFEWVDPLPDASALTATEATGVGDHDSPAARAYHRAMGVTTAEWWDQRRG